MSLLTLYRPNFCAACGNKILRLRWRVWTSRRFCAHCYTQFRTRHWLQFALLVLALLAIGLVAGRALRPRNPPLVIQRNIVANTSNSNAPIAELTVDDMYICGARTKKGAPCSRRVHGQVRCWQHKGMPAMLPVEKLKIKQ